MLAMSQKNKNKKNPAHFFFLLLNHEVHFYCTKFPSCIFLVYNNESFSMEGLSLLLRNMKRILRYRGESRNQKDNQKVLQVPPCTLEHGFLYPSLLWKKTTLRSCMQLVGSIVTSPVSVTVIASPQNGAN